MSMGARLCSVEELTAYTKLVGRARFACVHVELDVPVSCGCSSCVSCIGSIGLKWISGLDVRYRWPLYVTSPQPAHIRTLSLAQCYGCPTLHSHTRTRNPRPSSYNRYLPTFTPRTSLAGSIGRAPLVGLVRTWPLQLMAPSAAV